MALLKKMSISMWLCAILFMSTLLISSQAKDGFRRRRWCRNAREVGGDGAAAAVVLAHGYGLNQASWEKVLPSISHARVLLFDWDFTAAGGDEDEDETTFERLADDLIALMDEREVRGAVFVGHSMSAMVGCVASARRPDLFSHLLLLCGSPRYINSKEDGYVGGFEEESVRAMLAAMEADFHGWVKSFVPNAAGTAAAPDVVELLEQSFLAMDPAAALRLARMLFLGDQRAAALDAVPVSMPCSIVQVRKDFVAPPGVAEYMRRRLMSRRHASAAADVGVVIVESAGHFPQLVAPWQVADVLNNTVRLLPSDTRDITAIDVTT